MAKFIGSDLLDIGSSKWTQHMDELDSEGLGMPEIDQFMLPAVENVRSCFPHL